MGLSTGPAADPAPLFGPQMLVDPYPVYQQLRSTDPVHWDQTSQAWILTRYRDVVAALHDARLSSDRISYLRELAGAKDL
jgi:cytochrome P450